MPDQPEPVREGWQVRVIRTPSETVVLLGDPADYPSEDHSESPLAL